MELKMEINKLIPPADNNILYENCCVKTVDKSILYSEFFEKYMSNNLPCIVRGTSDDWECTSKWILNDTINTDYLSKVYGHLDAPVADCNNLEYNAHCKSIMKVSHYMSHLKQKSGKLLYLKDWHLKKLQPMANFYDVPLIFASDWLNEYSVDCDEDDYMFVYIGPKESWTPLHTDVYCSYSWSVNIVGRKQWILFPPGEEHKLKDKLGNLPTLFNPEAHPNIKYLEIIQEKGDALFVPSGWFHQVINVLDTISINHNWINGCNIKKVWEALQTNLMLVEKEIEEFKDSDDYSQKCQLILKSVFGMDCKMFVSFICHIAEKRLRQLKTEQPRGFGNYVLGINHINFDLRSIFDLMNIITNNSLVTNDNIIPIQMQKTLFTLKDLISNTWKE